jgi:hypothetical protein
LALGTSIARITITRAIVGSSTTTRLRATSITGWRPGIGRWACRTAGSGTDAKILAQRPSDLAGFRPIDRAVFVRIKGIEQFLFRGRVSRWRIVSWLFRRLG